MRISKLFDFGQTYFSFAAIISMLLATVPIPFALATEHPTGRSTTVTKPSPESTKPIKTAALDGTTGAAASKLVLVAGNLQAQIGGVTPGETVSAGSSTIAEVTIKYTGKRRSSDAELLLSAEGAKFMAISGRRIRVSKSGANRIARVRGLRRGKPRTVVVELSLGGGESLGGNLTKSLLSITLRPRRRSEQQTDSTILTWSVIDCATQFHGALQQLFNENGERLNVSLKSASAASRDFPGRWLFPVRLQTQKPKKKWVYEERTERKKVCTRSKSRRYRTSSGRVRRKRRCVAWTTRNVKRRVRVAVPVAEPSSAERQRIQSEMNLIRTATPFARARGAAQDLSKKGRFGFVSRRIATDLRTYLRQPKHPALCTGTSTMMDYLYGGASSFRGRIAQIAANSVNAHVPAEARVERLLDELMGEPGGHPGFGGAPLSVLQPEPKLQDRDAQLRALIDRIAELSLSQSHVALVKSQTETFAALRQFSRLIRKGAMAGYSKAVQTATHQALGMIEAAHYLRAANRRYANVNSALFGSIEAIRGAHAKHCVCGN